MQVGLVVVAAGSGTRFGGPKQFAMLGYKPVLAHCLSAFDPCHRLLDRVVVLPADLLDSPEWGRIRAGLRHSVRAVPGGIQRADSVRAGVAALDSRCDVVAVHDGARPFVPIEAFTQCLTLLQADAETAAAIVCAPVTDTLKALAPDHATIAQTVDRGRMVRAETPQVCRRQLLEEALSQPGADCFTDEGQAIESLGHRTCAVVQTGFNIKITAPADLHAAQAWLRSRELPSNGETP